MGSFVRLSFSLAVCPESIRTSSDVINTLPDGQISYSDGREHTVWAYLRTAKLQPTSTRIILYQQGQPGLYI